MENAKNTYFYSLIMFLIMALIESILKRDKNPSLSAGARLWIVKPLPLYVATVAKG
jgi:hypothetical protein